MFGWANLETMRWRWCIKLKHYRSRLKQNLYRWCTSSYLQYTLRCPLPLYINHLKDFPRRPWGRRMKHVCIVYSIYCVFVYSNTNEYPIPKYTELPRCYQYSQTKALLWSTLLQCMPGLLFFANAVLTLFKMRIVMLLFEQDTRFFPKK